MNALKTDWRIQGEESQNKYKEDERHMYRWNTRHFMARILTNHYM